VAVAFVLVGSLIFLFGFVVWVGPPYLPTMRLQIKTALDMLDLNPGETMLELGSGDGRVARAAAQRGIKVVGYEINPLLVLYSRIITWRYRNNVRIIWGNLWTKQWPDEASAIYTFLLEKFMPKLDNKITQTYNGKNIKLVSFAFSIPGKKAVQDKNGVLLYRYDT
jgi:SAM-dependent methyltransferase